MQRKRLLEQLYDVKICDISVLYNVSYRMTSSALAEVNLDKSIFFVVLGSCVPYFALSIPARPSKLKDM